ncbi:G-protein beta WD-40 repeat-containing protein [Cynara cardunculus var. scolymus]|uniref:Katanin p80 WD40 repeat-containing subunit B1 homolog n=1 Tax=Cynara cardunculus var. scolymus TaxID=59895 RepID=A0A103XF26_CYNCS|nr:G-protein beta WD-40 repeat-containing protein [Cynara cardunculus var. scolymus]
MAKRGYKLQEFVAHSANVNCIKIGKKTHRNFITGGDDEKVNLWSIGKPSAITSLSGHTSPIESVAFDSTEVFVAAGASSGVIKLWDLEEIKVVRTLNGHRSYCTAVEFHPFGEFFASGSMDTNLKIWDIRKKGCIHTYKGHRRAVSTIRFSPDGRWVVSGGLDNVVKIWDLTAGKLLHEFKFHEGHIRSMEFHPLEFLLATGSSDRTVKFWDLETFELIGSTRPEATGVRSITFHPDGRTLFCGLDSSLKVYSWEPVVCHDAVDMGWSTLGDLCIDDGKLLGCSYYQNSVAVWVADTSHIEQHGHNILAEDAHVQPKINLREGLTERVGNPRRPTNTMSPDDDPKDIKNIYVDSVTPVASRKTGSLPTVVNLPDPKEIDDLSTRKQVPASKIIGQADVAVVHGRTRSLVERFEKREKLNTDECQTPDLAPHISSNTDKPALMVKPTLNVVPCAIPEAKTSPVCAKTPDVVPFEEPKAKTSRMQMPVKAPDVVPCPVPEAKTFTVPEKRPNVVSIAATEAKSSSTVQKPDSGPNIKSEEANSSPALVIQRPRTAPSMLPEKGKASPMQRSASTRRLFPDKVRSSPMMVARRSTASSRIIPERTKTSPMLVVQRHDTPNRMIPEKAKSSPLLDDSPQTTGRGLTSKKEDDVADELMLNHDAFLSSLRSRLTKLQVVRHFWERNDARGAINALRKLPDHAVHADVVNVLTDRMEFFTLDLFASLHISVSLELLLKLVAVFGPVVSSTISAPPTVGVDLHAEKRLESCNQCHIQLQKINKCLPAIIRRGGLPARCAQELNVILQQS